LLTSGKDPLVACDVAEKFHSHGPAWAFPDEGAASAVASVSASELPAVATPVEVGDKAADQAKETESPKPAQKQSAKRRRAKKLQPVESIAGPSSTALTGEDNGKEIKSPLSHKTKRAAAKRARKQASLEAVITKPDPSGEEPSAGVAATDDNEEKVGVAPAITITRPYGTELSAEVADAEDVEIKRKRAERKKNKKAAARLRARDGSSARSRAVLHPPPRCYHRKERTKFTKDRNSILAYKLSLCSSVVDEFLVKFLGWEPTPSEDDACKRTPLEDDDDWKTVNSGTDEKTVEDTQHLQIDYDSASYSRPVTSAAGDSLERSTVVETDAAEASVPAERKLEFSRPKKSEFVCEIKAVADIASQSLVKTRMRQKDLEERITELGKRDVEFGKDQERAETMFEQGRWYQAKLEFANELAAR
jgi:hypothetical protein